LIWQNNFTFRGLCLHKPQGKMSVKGSKTRNVLAGLPSCNCIKELASDDAEKMKLFVSTFFLDKKSSKKIKAHEK
jgi:hypothetical protein